MRIAAIAPANYEGYWLGQASRELLVELDRLAEVEVFLDRNPARHEAPPAGLFWRDVREFAARSRSAPGYDATLLVLGNDAFYCEQAYVRHLHRPGGIVWLFDETLQHFVQTVSVYRGDSALYRRTMTHCHGEAGHLAADLILSGHGNERLFVEYDCLKTVVEIASGILCPTRHLLARTARYPKNLEPETAVIPLWVAGPGTGASDREGDESRGFRILCLPGQSRRALSGILSWVAGDEEARRMGAVLAVEAEGGEESDWLRVEARRAGCAGRVEVIEPSAGAASDVVVDLRHPWPGERLRDCLRRMASGSVLVLGDFPEIEDFPDEACLRVPAGAGREEILREGLAALAAWPDRRRAIAGHAHSFVLARRTPAGAARKLHDFLVGHAQALGEKAAIQRGIHVVKRHQDALIFEKRLRDEIRETILGEWEDWPAPEMSRALDAALTEMGLDRKGSP